MVQLPNTSANNVYNRIASQQRYKFVLMVSVFAIIVSLCVIVGIFAFRKHNSSLISLKRELVVDKSKSNKDSDDIPGTGAGFTNETLTPSVALIVVGLGLDSSSINDAYSLPNYVTLGFTPYTDNLNNVVSDASARGYEVLVQIPMQPLDYESNDPGPYALLENLSKQDNEDRLTSIINKITGHITGVYLNEDEVFTSSIDGISTVLPILAQNNLALIYYDPGSLKPISRVQEQMKLKLRSITFGVIVDQILDIGVINNQLKKLQITAMLKGKAIGVLRPYPLCIDAVKVWLAAIEKENIKVVPVSKLLTPLVGIQAENEG
ncbi:conserved hypothetical protein [Alphaproteobacteria bacterium]